MLDKRFSSILLKHSCTIPGMDVIDRLDELLNDQGVPSRQRRRKLADLCGISPQAVAQWYSHETRRISSDYLNQVATHYGASLKWLISGEGPMYETAIREAGENYSATPLNHGQVPLVSWVVAGEWCETNDPYPLGQGEDQVLCPYPHSDNTIALTVSGDSMAPEYMDGDIIFVDGKVSPDHNDDVICRTPDGNSTFKRYQETPEGRFLMALNPNWPDRIVKVPEGSVICGVVIGMSRRKKR